ncbi:uroporphyrinogen-III C-methyltransferase [Sphingorhabdus sp.]|uniref:uroporphyrinogen-III C-methyltransferase n=1 Tax=Sphingorhabdus sp. TaxID=1902408 RepID=UPI00359350FA
MKKARVFLVGAGPGDPELLTLKAARLISTADVVVHDGLVDDAIMAMINPAARLISVAKSRSKHTVPQEGINDILVREALAGHMVVRLKGGDPFIFGRGGEEAESCREAGIDVEVVPGISAAMGGAAGALLPLTHRDASSAVTFVAGQCKGLTDQNWAGLAGKGRTLVIYMGIATAADITEKLICDGLSPDTPVAVLERVTRPNSRALRTILTDLGDMIVREKVTSPAIIIVGDVVLKSDAEDRLIHFAKQAETLA